jgi:ankyrin repeat protein
LVFKIKSIWMEVLLESARYGEEEVVRELLASAAAGQGDLDLNGRDGRGNTALHMASANGNLGIVQLLLAANKDASSNGDESAKMKVDVNATTSTETRHCIGWQLSPR